MLPRSNEPMRRMITVHPKFLLFIALMLTVVFGIAFSIQTAQLRRMNAEVRDVQQAVVDARAQVEALENKLVFTGTDEYIAQEARRRFGYMGEDETRYVVDGEGGYSINSATQAPVAVVAP